MVNFQRIARLVNLLGAGTDKSFVPLSLSSLQVTIGVCADAVDSR